jgi:hypothetical protein
MNRQQCICMYVQCRSCQRLKVCALSRELRAIGDVQSGELGGPM